MNKTRNQESLLYMGGEYETADGEEVVVEEHVVFVEEHEDDGYKMSTADNLSFVAKVYGIVFTQLAFTVAFVVICMKNI
jgi:hypothetical protein